MRLVTKRGQQVFFSHRKKEGRAEKMLELLEERRDSLIVLDDAKNLRVVEKNPYTILKYKWFKGGRIRYSQDSDDGTISVEETEDRVFKCALNGSAVMIDGLAFEVSSAILLSDERQRFDAIRNLWKSKYTECFLGIRFATVKNRSIELTRDGQFLLPKSVALQICDWTSYHDGSRVVKIVLLREPNNSSADRIFTHELQSSPNARVVMNSLAVALMGRDEVGQYWMHVLPPEYRNSPMESCEMWLAGGEVEKDELIF